MAKTKITALTELTDTNIAIGDLIPIVDISDTSQAASGTTKKVTITSLATAVASAFSGDSPTFVNLTTTGTTTLGDSGDATTVNGTLGVTGVATFTDNIVMASGKGIDFSATANSSGTMTSELLSDYEEGTWTPTLTPATSGTITITSPNACGYTKIGSVVTVVGLIDTASVSSPVGTTVTINNLPFASNATGSQRSAGTARGFNLTSGQLGTTMVIISSVTTSVLYIDASLFQAGSQVYFQLTYFV